MAGLLLAQAAVKLLARFGPADVPRLHAISIDTHVLLFAFVASLLTGFCSGPSPRWRSQPPAGPPPLVPTPVFYEAR